MKKMGFLAALVSAVVVAACGTVGGKGDSGPKNPPPVDFPDEVPTDPVPTGTPTGPIWLTELTSEAGDVNFGAGECMGFTLTTDTYEFKPGVTVFIDPFSPIAVPATWLSPNRIRVGGPDTAFTCLWTKVFGPTGLWDVIVKNGPPDETWLLEDVLKVSAPNLFEMGSVVNSRKWSVDAVLAEGANVFERPYDVDIYRVNFVEGPERVYDHMEFFATGVPALVPTMEIWDPNSTLSFLGRGGLGLIFPKSGTMFVVVKDTLGQGGASSTYDLGFYGKNLGSTPSPSDNCFNAPYIQTNTGTASHTNYDSLENNFDPNFAAGCRDSNFNTPIKGPGNDAVWKVVVPAGQELRVSTYDDHIDNVVYLLPTSILSMSSGTSGCPQRPTVCTAAAGRFGGGNTDTLRYKNLTLVDEEFFLIHDSATVMTNDVGSFLLNVEIINR